MPSFNGRAKENARMIKRHLLSGMLRFALPVFLGLAPSHGAADEMSPSGGDPIDGIYELKDVTAAGVYSAEEEEGARQFVGDFLTIHGDHVVLPTRELCHIASSPRRTLKNDWDSFGTAGGSWSQVGLQKTSEAGYDVTEIALDCDGPFRGLVIQPESETYLLAYWSVYLVLGRE